MCRFQNKIHLYNICDEFFIIEWRLMEKARVIAPFGHAGQTPLGKIRMTLAGEIKMTPVEASAGEFFEL